MHGDKPFIRGCLGIVQLVKIVFYFYLKNIWMLKTLI